MTRIVVQNSIPQFILKPLRLISRRAQELPQESHLAARGKLANVHAGGARTRVTRPIQLALIRATGQAPPRIGSELVNPPRPIGVTPKTTKEAGRDMARFVVRGGKLRTQQIMLAGVMTQFDAGGIPSWRKSRRWGRWVPRNPTLGGRGGSVADGWRQATYRTSG